MILTGKEIEEQVDQGNITISPFDPSNLNPNSYNYSLGDCYKEVSASEVPRAPERPNTAIPLPPAGLLMRPGVVYLCHTKEVIGSQSFVASLIGRSSVGRLGLFLQLSADLGNLGPAHRWTLELTCAQSLIVYPGMIVGQVSFWVPTGEIVTYKGRYTDYSEPMENLYRFGESHTK